MARRPLRRASASARRTRQARSTLRKSGMSRSKSRLKEKRRADAPRAVPPPPPLDDVTETDTDFDFGAQYAEEEFDGGEPERVASLQKNDIHFDSRIRIIRKIADGGMGSVYLAEQIGEVEFVKTVALKVIKADRLRDNSSVQLFLDEAKLTADLVHQNIAQVYYLGKSGRQYFIVMEFLHAKTLREFMREHRIRKLLPPINFSAFIVSRICRALSYAHTKTDRNGQPLGIVHRDVTPSNVMIDFRGFVKLTDFGIAKALTMNIPDETKVVMGKFPYMSPEQAAGTRTDGRSDIFSLGLVLYELLTGTRVYTPKTRRELLYMMNNYRIKDPRRINSRLPDELADLVMLALEKQVNDRFQNAREMGDALERYMYSKGYGPTNEKLARYMAELFPDIDRDRIE